jgi:DeoR family transcriptional regulator, fructose operon transcriptional repressor
MLVAERQRAILGHLAKNGNVSVSDLCQLFEVSEMTIRRDLADLEKQGLLQRTYGGAIPTEPAFFEMSSRAKQSVFTEEKERIGSLCAEMIRDGEVIFLDSGTTTLQVARCIKSKTLTLVTNDLNIASELLDYPNIEVHITGGILRRGTNNLIGVKASSFFDDIRGTKLFLAVEGVDLKAGLTVPDINEVPMKRKMIDSASEVIVVADHSKLGRNSMNIIAHLSAANCLVTDRDAPEEILRALKDQIQVTLA